MGSRLQRTSLGGRKNSDESFAVVQLADDSGLEQVGGSKS